MSVDVISWVVIAGAVNSLMVQAYGPFTSLDAALQWINNMPNGWTGNVYEMRTPLAAAMDQGEARAKVDRLVRAFDNYMRPQAFDEQQAWLELKAAMYQAGWREDGA